jgi:hypothetical protein
MQSCQLPLTGYLQTRRSPYTVTERRIAGGSERHTPDAEEIMMGFRERPQRGRSSSKQWLLGCLKTNPVRGQFPGVQSDFRSSRAGWHSEFPLDIWWNSVHRVFILPRIHDSGWVLRDAAGFSQSSRITHPGVWDLATRSRPCCEYRNNNSGRKLACE